MKRNGMSKFIGDVIWSLAAELGLIGLWIAKLEVGNGNQENHN